MTAAATSPVVNRRQLEQIIADLPAAVVLATSDGNIVQANEAALAMHGCEHVDELGKTVKGYHKRFKLCYLNHHELKPRQYPLARLLAGQPCETMAVALSRVDDDSFHRVLELRGLQIVDASGQPDSLVMIGTDVTERASAQERFERAFASNPAPAVILQLENLSYIKVNRGFLDMTGYAADDVVGTAFPKLDVLRHAQHRTEALRLMHEHGTIPQQEATLQIAGGDEQFVIVAGQPIKVDEQPCILFTFSNIDDRKKTETSLRHSEELFATAFRLAPVPMLVCTQHDLRIIEANAAFVAVTGHNIDDAPGQTLGDVGFPVKDSVLDELHADTTLRRRELQLHSRDGVAVNCLLSAESITIHGENCILCVLQDVTERKRSEHDLMTAIEVVMQDTSWFSRTVMERLGQIRNPSDSGSDLDALTTRERQVLERICKGQTDAEIAAALQISRNTVRNHVANLYNKIGVNRRSAAVVWGRERGLAAY